MIQFYADPRNLLGERLELRDQEAHHANNVLRLSVGDLFWATDGRGSRYQAEVVQVGRHEIIGAIQKKEQYEAPQTRVGLALAPTKQRQRLETAIEKAVELGVDEIYLMNSQRTERGKVRMDRLETIVTTAVKQSLRTWRPKLHELQDFQRIITQHSDNIWLAHEAIAQDQKPGFTQVQQQRIRRSSRILLLVGPEGGFTEEEVAQAQEKQAELISLGTHRLRAETAAIAFLSLLLPFRT
ncbi:MAG: RsmE family RNA methyltransferase [Bacteroidota bacterium]